MIISDILSEKGIEVDLKSKNKDEVLGELVDLLDEAYQLENIEEIRKSIIERESLSSTGICNGLAIPHAKVQGITKILGGIGLSKNGIDFNSMDHQLSKIFFILISPKDDHGNHVKSLARITKILKDEDSRLELLNCNNTNEVMAFLKRKEGQL